MFLRKRGRRILLLHSYRDGQGKVCQARLGHFLEVGEARRCLAQRAWREDFARRFPEVNVDWQQLLEQARKLKRNAPQPSRPRPLEVRLDQALGSFLRLWAQVEDPQLAQQVAEVVRDRLRLAETPPISPQECLEKGDSNQLEALGWRARAQLDPRRTRIREGAELYTKTLARRAQVLQNEGLQLEASQVLEELAQIDPTPEHQADYAAALQVLGRDEEAVLEYQRLARDSAVRYYNLASLYCRQGRMDEALGQMMKGLLRDSKVATQADHRYWQTYSHLWDPVSRWFLRGTYAQPLVRARLSLAVENRTIPRELVKGKARRLLLQRVLHWDPPKPCQITARRKRSKTASQSGS